MIGIQVKCTGKRECRECEEVFTTISLEGREYLVMHFNASVHNSHSSIGVSVEYEYTMRKETEDE